MFCKNDPNVKNSPKIILFFGKNTLMKIIYILKIMEED
jgi:hypothetical protein